MHHTIMHPSVAFIRHWVFENTKEIPKERSFFFRENYYTRAQVSAHNTPMDGWVLDETTREIYNITPIFDPALLGHPAISNTQMYDSLRSRLGGAKDVSTDKTNHRGHALAFWSAMKIGRLSGQ